MREISRGVYIYEESIVREKHQFSGSTESTEMLYLVTMLYECETWRLSKGMMKKLGGIRTLVSKKNVENTLY